MINMSQSHPPSIKHPQSVVRSQLKMHPLGPSHGVFGTFTLGLRKRNEVKGHTPSCYLDIPYKNHICVCIGWFKSTCLQFFGHVLLVQIPISHHLPRVFMIQTPSFAASIPHLCTCCWLKCWLVPATCQGLGAWAFPPKKSLANCHESNDQILGH
jgi:hypothetical protein